MSVNPGLFSSDKDEWETPLDLFAALDEKFRFTLDAAASAENAKCERYWTKEDDALLQPWEGIVWCNPPYGRIVADFVRKGYEEARKGATVVMLLASRTDTRWWHDYVMKAYEVHLIKGRLRFVGAPNSAPFPSCIVLFWRPPGSPVFYSMDTKGRPVA